MSDMQAGLPTSTDKLKDALTQAIDPADQAYEKNKRYSIPPPDGGYLTKLTPDEETKFQQWAQQFGAIVSDGPKADYDMRGFWKAQQSGDPAAATAVNPNDKQIHFPDTYKTPYHESFSRESKFATPDAPTWNDQDQLVAPDGAVVFDERKVYAARGKGKPQ